MFRNNSQGVSRMNSLEATKRDILHVCRCLYQRGLVAATEGNVSVRTGADRVIVTPTGMSKGFLQESDLVEVDLEGNPVRAGGRRATSEIKLHLKCYRMRADISAVVHAHPPAATAFSTVGRTIDESLFPEAIVTMGRVPLVPYGTPGTDELAGLLEEYLPQHEVFLLANNGALALGKNVIEAWHRMECLEQSAMTQYLAESLGKPNPLSGEQIARLRQVFGIKTIPASRMKKSR